MVAVQPFLDPVLERVGHSVPRHGDLYAAVVRAPAPEPEIVFLGRVTPYKGIVGGDRGARAAALRARRARAPGRGRPRGRRARRARCARSPSASASPPRSSWRGQLPAEEVAGALAGAHALIVPSVWEEPFPLVTIEGALARVPLVASDVGGIGEGMHDEEHALLFARGDARGAATALARILGEAEQTAARVERAHERAQQFRLEPYLQAQERFVLDAHAALVARPRGAAAEPALGSG